MRWHDATLPTDSQWADTSPSVASLGSFDTMIEWLDGVGTKEPPTSIDEAEEMV